MSSDTGTGKYEQLLARCKDQEPVPTVVAHPCDETALAGARVPIILTSRADNLRSRVASCAIAMLVAHDRRRKLRQAASDR